MGELRFEPPRLLALEDDLSAFHSGVEVVDSWVAKWARKAMSSNTARVYVACAGGKVAGIYSLSTYAVKRGSGIAGALRRNSPDPIPCTLLGMLGVDESFQGVGLGWSLLQNAILRAKKASEVVASRALVVEPATGSAAAFYQHFGFKPLDDQGRLFLPL